MRESRKSRSNVQSLGYGARSGLEPIRTHANELKVRVPCLMGGDQEPILPKLTLKRGVAASMWTNSSLLGREVVKSGQRGYLAVQV